MSKPSIDDIESNWVIVSDTIDIGEEVFESDIVEKQHQEDENMKSKDQSSDNSETDSIGVLSETSSFQECDVNDEVNNLLVFL